MRGKGDVNRCRILVIPRKFFEVCPKKKKKSPSNSAGLEIAQWVKYLLCKLEDLGFFILSIHIKM